MTDKYAVEAAAALVADFGPGKAEAVIQAELKEARRMAAIPNWDGAQFAQGQVVHYGHVLRALKGEDPIKAYRADPICPHAWEAHRDSYEPPMPVGVGKTEQGAIDDLIEQEEERAA